MSVTSSKMQSKNSVDRGIVVRTDLVVSAGVRISLPLIYRSDRAKDDEQKIRIIVHRADEDAYRKFVDKTLHVISFASALSKRTRFIVTREEDDTVKFVLSDGWYCCAKEIDCVGLWDAILNGYDHCDTLSENMVRNGISLVVGLQNANERENDRENVDVSDSESDDDDGGDDDDGDVESLCKVCYRKPKTHALLPCGHLAYCHRCVERMCASKACAVCKQPTVAFCKIISC